MHKHFRASFIGLVCLCLTSLAGLAPATHAQDAKPAAAAPRKLVVGDSAPALKVAKWVKGDEIKGFEKGTAYIVEFWATWCAPCRKSIPHLTDVAKAYKDKGVKVIGVSIWETTKEKDGKTYRNPLPEVEKFVSEMGDKMVYHVAYGGDEPEMSDTWMRAANRSGIPSAFIVDKEGRIAWIGHPMDSMEETLDQVLSGHFDPKAALEASRKKEEMKVKAKELGMRLRGTIQAGKAKESFDVVREMMRIDPKMFPNAAGTAFQQAAVNLGQLDLAYAFAKEMFAGPIRDSEQDLNTIAWTILDDAAIKDRDLDMAFAMAQRSVEVTKGKDGSMLDTLARAYWEKGDAAKAVETQTLAVEAAKDDARIPDMVKSDMKKTLQKYKAGGK